MLQRQAKNEAQEKNHAGDMPMSRRDELVVEILKDRAAGKTRDQIFDDLVDRRKMDRVYVGSVLESLRW